MLKLLVLALIWLSWSGHYTLEEPLIAAFGVASCLLVLWLDRRMQQSYSLDEKRTLTVRWVGYIPYLLWEIVKANLAVAKIVLSKDLPIRRQLVRIPISQRGSGARVLHANSITLTPGTITLSVRHDSMLIHAIDDAAAEGVKGLDMDRRASELEREES